MTIYTLTYSFSYLEPFCCSMSSSNYCFLTCIQVSKKQVRWSGFWFREDLILVVTINWKIMKEMGGYSKLCSWSFTSFALLSSLLIFCLHLLFPKPCSWAEVWWQPKMLNTAIWWYFLLTAIFFSLLFSIWHHLALNYANYATSGWNCFFFLILVLLC